MKKYFLDCGTNVGQSLTYFIKNGVINKDTIVYTFEPNEVSLNIAKKRVNERHSEYNITFLQKAVWVEDCKRSLTIEYSPGDYTCQLNPEDTIQGNNHAGGATNIMGNEWNKPHYIKDDYIKRGPEIDCIDFSAFLRDNVEDDSYVICKMDIEGAEYKVLRKLIFDDTIKKISDLYVEWHAHMLKSDNDTASLVRDIQNKNVKLSNWI